VAIVPGFTSYFSFPQRKAGYSGVATFCRLDSTPETAEDGITGILGSGCDTDMAREFDPNEMRELDKEGRCVVTRHMVITDNGIPANLTILNVYVPRPYPEKGATIKLQMQFFKAIDIKVNTLRKRGDLVVVVGDMNTSHREEDCSYSY
jgi:AP endonuclease-2